MTMPLDPLEMLRRNAAPQNPLFGGPPQPQPQLLGGAAGFAQGLLGADPNVQWSAQDQRGALANALTTAGTTMAEMSGGARRWGEFRPSGLASALAGLQAGREAYQQAQGQAKGKQARAAAYAGLESEDPQVLTRALRNALTIGDQEGATAITNVLRSRNINMPQWEMVGGTAFNKFTGQVGPHVPTAAELKTAQEAQNTATEAAALRIHPMVGAILPPALKEANPANDAAVVARYAETAAQWDRFHAGITTASQTPNRTASGLWTAYNQRVDDLTRQAQAASRSLASGQLMQMPSSGAIKRAALAQMRTHPGYDADFEAQVRMSNPDVIASETGQEQPWFGAPGSSARVVPPPKAAGPRNPYRP